MKLLRSLLFSILFGIVLTAYAVDQGVQVDILMAKIINAQKEGRAADALPAMSKLESMEPSLGSPLSEGFHFLYVNTLYETGDHTNALRRANIYMDKYGKRGKNYAKVVDIMSRLEEEADKNAKAAAEKEVADAREKKEAAVASCERTLRDAFDAIKRRNWAMREDGKYVSAAEYRNVQTEAREAVNRYDNSNCERILYGNKFGFASSPEQEKLWNAFQNNPNR